MSAGVLVDAAPAFGSRDPFPAGGVLGKDVRSADFGRFRPTSRVVFGEYVRGGPRGHVPGRLPRPAQVQSAFGRRDPCRFCVPGIITPLARYIKTLLGPNLLNPREA